jgi:hypothetical protein
MPIEVEIDDRVKLEISEFTTEKGRSLISIRRMSCSKPGGKFFPQKTKAGGYNLIFLSLEEWTAILPRLKTYLDSLRSGVHDPNAQSGSTRKPPPERQPSEKPKPKKPVDDTF